MMNSTQVVKPARLTNRDFPQMKYRNIKNDWSERRETSEKRGSVQEDSNISQVKLCPRFRKSDTVLLPRAPVGAMEKA